MPGFEGTGKTSVTPELLDHYAEEMGRGARPQGILSGPFSKCFF